jgi:hypothetical protein
MVKLHKAVPLCVRTLSSTVLRISAAHCHPPAWTSDGLRHFLQVERKHSPQVFKVVCGQTSPGFHALVMMGMMRVRFAAATWSTKQPRREAPTPPKLFENTTSQR